MLHVALIFQSSVTLIVTLGDWICRCPCDLISRERPTHTHTHTHARTKELKLGKRLAKESAKSRQTWFAKNWVKFDRNVFSSFRNRFSFLKNNNASKKLDRSGGGEGVWQMLFLFSFFIFACAKQTRCRLFREPRRSSSSPCVNVGAALLPPDSCLDGTRVRRECSQFILTDCVTSHRTLVVATKATCCW
jgi:hypothetical protein